MTASSPNSERAVADHAGRPPTGSTRGFEYLLRIPIYYVALALLVVAALWALPPSVLELVSPADQLPSAEGPTFGGVPAQSQPLPEGFVRGGAVAFFSLIGALVVMIPVAWSYIFIKRRGGYDESVVHALLILPIAVTGIVLIVRSSLALAFSLAGIVAAVRFRTTLSDTKDAVYVFLAIGVGLAAGVQHVGVALVLSIVFNAVTLVLWRLNFGNVYADQIHRTGGLSFGDSVAGVGSAASAFSVGDPTVMAALSPTELKEVAERLGRMRAYLHSESDRKKERKRYSVLMVYTSKPEQAQELVEKVLSDHAETWRFAELVDPGGGVKVLEYLVRLLPHHPSASVVERLREEGGETVQAAEIRSLKRLAGRG